MPNYPTLTTSRDSRRVELIEQPRAIRANACDGKPVPCKISSKEREVVLDLFARHFNAHSLIPDANVMFRTPEAIYKKCATEMYRWCKQWDHVHLWAYLWMH
ncbi:hypothetical protein K470DRAFT_260821 [Piedraia hortae CBS 480.64]|uniref:Uncharacterized protein n=1 Tax=Piedraia hortae CBS 480.64 TaxID=1314780 RepID=A0A6A7BQ21_9PEZI|nr:hypothetical protein K470DRAFT_260821 [Piedraia hortae CBS 480.64]